MNDDLIGLYYGGCDAIHFHCTLQDVYPRGQYHFQREANRMFLDAKYFKEQLDAMSRLATQYSLMAENVKVKLSTLGGA